MKYHVWDEIILRVDDQFGYKDKVVSRLKVMVLGFESDVVGNRAQYLCYVPPYEKVPYGFNTFVIDRHHQRHFKFDQKFIGDTGCFITAANPIHKHIPAAQGERCDHCNEFFAGAVRDENGYKCRSCRENPYR